MKKQFLIVLLIVSLFIIACGNEPPHVYGDFMFVVGHVESVSNGYYKYSAEHSTPASPFYDTTHDGPVTIYIHRDVVKYDVGDTIRVNFVKKENKRKV